MFRFFFCLQLYVAPVHILHFYEEWTKVLLLLSSEHTADSSMDTDWVSRDDFHNLFFALTACHHVAEVEKQKKHFWRVSFGDRSQ